MAMAGGVPPDAVAPDPPAAPLEAAADDLAGDDELDDRVFTHAKPTRGVGRGPPHGHAIARPGGRRYLRCVAVHARPRSSQFSAALTTRRFSHRRPGAGSR